MDSINAVLAENLTIEAPGVYRERLLNLAIFRRHGRVPKGERRHVRFYTNEPAQIVLPRGLLDQVLEVVPLQIVDRRLLLPPIDFAWRGRLRPEQIAAAQALVSAGDGMLVGVPGSGKTNTGLAAVAACRQPALWLVHTKDLAHQALDRARSLYGLPDSAYGYIGEGMFSVGTHLTVAIIRSLTRPRPQLVGIERRFGCVVVDEAHHVPALSMARAVSRFPARYRFGCTATPERTDGLGALAQAILGYDQAVIDTDVLLAHGRIMLPTVRIVTTTFQHGGASDWAHLQRARAGAIARNVQICDLVGRNARAGRRILVLVDLVAHAKMLARVLTRRYAVPTMAVVGAVATQLRGRAYTAVEQGGLVLVATRLADEGLDLPSLDCLVLAAPGRSAPRLQQQIGRVMRAWGPKRAAWVYDFVDPGVEVLLAQARERLRVYRSLGLAVERQV